MRPPGVKHRHTPNEDIVIWSNKDVPNDKLFIAFAFAGCLFWIGAIVYVTSLLLIPSLEVTSLISRIALMYISIIGWGVALVMPTIFLRLVWTVTIEISNSDVGLSYQGILSPKKRRFKKSEVRRLSFEKRTTRSMQPSLMIVSRRDRLFIPEDTILAPWMKREQAYQLFLLLKHILEARGWDIEYRAKYRRIP